MDHGSSPGRRWVPPPATPGAPERTPGTGGHPSYRGATGPVGPPPRSGATTTTGGGARRSGKRTVGLAAAVVLLVGIAGGAWWALTAPEASASQVSLETVSSSGSLPFGAPASNDATGVVAPDNAGGQLAGNTSGLYARPAGASPCDSAAIVSGLASDPAKAAAWAAPLGIGAGDIGAFVGGLSPLTLRADTAVTQYGYGDGQFQPYPAVLQAGTAVLVNSFGEPTVKCHNANPLGPPTASNSDGETSGEAWPGYTADRIVTVVAASAAQSRFVVVDDESDRQEPVDCPPQTIPPKQNPTPPTGPDKQLLLTGVHNYDNTITRSDGKIIRPDGSIVKPTVDVVHPPGSRTLADGGIEHPDGRVFNADGTERRPFTIPAVVIKDGLGLPIQISPARTVNPDGSVTPPLDKGSVHWNHDGSFLIIEPGTPGSVRIIDQKGVEHPPVPAFPAGSTVNGDGSVTTKEGKVLYPTGQERPPRVLIPPGDVVLDDKGGNTPPADQKATDEQDTQLGTKVVLGTGAGGGGVVQKGKDGELVPVQGQSTVVCDQAPCDPVPGQGAPGAPAAPGPLDKNGNPVVTAPGGEGTAGGTGGTAAPDCTTAPAGTPGCATVPEKKPVDPAPGTESGTTGTGGTTTGGEGTGGSGSGGSGGGSSGTGSGSGGGSSGGESGSGTN